MFGWLPRWHPLVWLLVIILVIAVWSDPSGWGHKVGGVFHLLPELANRASIFVQNI